MKPLITLMMMAFALIVEAQTTYPEISRTSGVYRVRGDELMRFAQVVNSSGIVPFGTILFFADTRIGHGTSTSSYTNGLFVYSHKEWDPTFYTNLTVMGNAIVTNIVEQQQSKDEFRIGSRRFESNDKGLFVSGVDFVNISQNHLWRSPVNPGYYVSPQLREERKRVQAERERLERLGVEERRTSLQEYKANTNLLSAQELEAKGIKIMFREVLSIEMFPTGDEKLLRPMVIRRWMPCSGPQGKPVLELIGM